MINKKSLWFVTLFSLILVLSVYYITMPSELLLTNNSSFLASKETDDAVPTVDVEESSILVALRVEANDQMASEIEDLKMILTSVDTSSDEKNVAFEKMKLLNIRRGEEEQIEAKIKTDFNLNSFVKINDDQIRVVVASSEHNTELANKIMRAIQENYDNKKYISVKFQK